MTIGNDDELEKLKADADNARLSKRLVTIREDVPLGVTLSDFEYRGPDRAALLKLFNTLEFRRLINDPFLRGEGPLLGAADHVEVELQGIEDVHDVEHDVRRAQHVAARVEQHVGGAPLAGQQGHLAEIGARFEADDPVGDVHFDGPRRDEVHDQPLRPNLFSEGRLQPVLPQHFPELSAPEEL